MSQFIFYLLSAFILIFGFLTVTSRRVLRAAVFLLFVLIATAGIYVLMNYLFMAAVQVAVYAGGIVVLIIFSVLLTSHIAEKLEKPDIYKVILSGLLVLAGVGLALFGILNHKFVASNVITTDATMKNIGHTLLSTSEGGYALPFEVISILLLAAMLAAIVIAKKQKN